MSDKEATETANPCAAEQNAYDGALETEAKLLKQLRAAQQKLGVWERMKEYPAVRRALSIGTWPEAELGPLEQTSELYHQYDTATFVKCARAVYLYRQDYEAARAEARKATDALTACKRTEAYRSWKKRQLAPLPKHRKSAAPSGTSFCGAPCTSRGREGEPCHHLLTARRICGSHGYRPMAASTAHG